MYCTALITQARIFRERDKPDEALALAEEAKGAAGDSKFTLIDACISKGEAAFALGKYQTAIDEFQQALEIGGGSRKVVAVSHLHLCRSYLASNQPSSATVHFKLWQATGAGIENSFLMALATKVQKSLAQAFPDFKLSKNDVRTATEHLNCLRRWLAETAVALDNGDEDGAAKRLDVSKAALKGWLRLCPSSNHAPAKPAGGSDAG